jgi:hypothetical protein
VIDAARLSVCECIVSDDAAVLAAHRRGHLAAGLAADNVTTGKDVRHVRPKEFIDTDLTSVAKFDAGALDGDSVGVRATARRDQKFLSAQPARLTASLDVNYDSRSVPSHRARGGAGDDFDSFFFEDFADGFAYLRLIAVREQMLATLHQGDFSAEAVKHLP